MPNHQLLHMVIGYPLKHTQSPLLHNAVYKLLDINAVLLAFPHTTLKPLIDAIKTLSVGLTAVTMPFKEEVIPYLDQCSPEVTLLKAANTIIQRDGKLLGYNTDIDGITYALRHVKISGKNVLIIGAGGAAQAVAYVMQQNKAKLYWLNRTVEKAVDRVKLWGGEVITRQQLTAMPMDIIINTTPVGMYPDVNNSPLSDYCFNSDQVVFDLVYNPVNTELLKQAQKSKAKIISGMDMFIGQGLRQVEIWKQEKLFTQDLGPVLKVYFGCNNSEIG